MRQFEPSFIRQILHVASRPDIISFAGGLPNAETFPVAEFRTACDFVLANHGYEALQYNTTAGHTGLRAWIADRLSATAGTRFAAEDIIITTGSQQALDLVAKLIGSGGRVAMENPGYLGAIQAFQSIGVEMTGVPLSPEGPDREALDAALNEAEFFYGMSKFQNPTGWSYNDEAVEMVAAMIAAKEAYFVEDDPYGEIYFTSAPGPRVIQQQPQRTIYLGSFSKSVAPSLRIGFVAAPAAIRVQLERAKQAADLHTSHFLQMALYRLLTTIDYEAHLMRVRDSYRQRMQRLVGALQKVLGDDVTVHKPAGGMFVWVEFPADVSTGELFAYAIEQHVAFVPGVHFHQSGGHNTARLNFTNANPDSIDAGVSRLAEAYRNYRRREVPVEL